MPVFHRLLSDGCKVRTFDFTTTSNYGDLYRRQFRNLLLAVNGKVRLLAVVTTS